MKTKWEWAGFAISMAIYAWILVIILRGILTRQSLATWGLWALLDLIVGLSIRAQGGNWRLVMFYVLGSGIVCVGLIITKQFSWTWFETATVVSIVICLIVWAMLGPKATTIITSLAVLLGSFPEIKDSWNKPKAITRIQWGGFLVVNIFYTFNGRGLEVKEILYPLTCVLICLALLFANLRKEVPAPTLM